MIDINLLPRKRKAAPRPAVSFSPARALPVVGIVVMVGILGYQNFTLWRDWRDAIRRAMLAEQANTTRQVQITRAQADLTKLEGALAAQDALAAITPSTQLADLLHQFLQRLPAGCQVQKLSLKESTLTLEVTVPHDKVWQLLVDIDHAPFYHPTYTSVNPNGDPVPLTLRIAVQPAPTPASTGGGQ